jgi:hypothetical protein
MVSAGKAGTAFSVGDFFSLTVSLVIFHCFFGGGGASVGSSCPCSMLLSVFAFLF